MWLTGRLIPDHKTIADFRKDSGPAIKQVCVQFIELCRLMGLLTQASAQLPNVFRQCWLKIAKRCRATQSRFAE
jgi:hypothetical protein